MQKPLSVSVEEEEAPASPTDSKPSLEGKLDFRRSDRGWEPRWYRLHRGNLICQLKHFKLEDEIRSQPASTLDLVGISGVSFDRSKRVISFKVGPLHEAVQLRGPTDKEARNWFECLKAIEDSLVSSPRTSVGSPRPSLGSPRPSPGSPTRSSQGSPTKSGFGSFTKPASPTAHRNSSSSVSSPRVEKRCLDCLQKTPLQFSKQLNSAGDMPGWDCRNLSACGFFTLKPAPGWSCPRCRCTICQDCYEAMPLAVEAASGDIPTGQSKASEEQMKRKEASDTPTSVTKMTVRDLALASGSSEPELSELMKKLCSRLKAAAYTPNGVDFDKLFREQDKDRSGKMSWGEFLSMCRRKLKLGEDELLLHALFNIIDADSCGEVCVDELIDIATKDAAFKMPSEILLPSEIAQAMRNHIAEQADMEKTRAADMQTARAAQVEQAQDSKAKKADAAASSSSGAKKKVSPIVERAMAMKLPADSSDLTVWMDLLKQISSRLKAAAYTTGGKDWDKLFRQSDRDRSGLIEWDEFNSLCRRALKMTDDDRRLRFVFNIADCDGSGHVSVEELISLAETDWTEVVFASEVQEPQKRPQAKSTDVTAPSLMSRGLTIVERAKTADIGDLVTASARIELLKQISSRLKAAAYTPRGKDWDKLFRQLDKDRSGSLEWAEFQSLCRRVLKIGHDEQVLRSVFNIVDMDGSGHVDIEEIVSLAELDWSEVDAAGDVPEQPKGPQATPRSTPGDGSRRPSDASALSAWIAAATARGEVTVQIDTITGLPVGHPVGDDGESSPGPYVPHTYVVRCRWQGQEKWRRTDEREATATASGCEDVVIKQQIKLVDSLIANPSSLELNVIRKLDGKKEDMFMGACSLNAQDPALWELGSHQLTDAKGRLNSMVRLRLKSYVAQRGSQEEVAPAGQATQRSGTGTARRAASRQQTDGKGSERSEGSEVVERMCSRMKAAAYTTGGASWEKLFREQDKDHSGDISWDEFYSMCRRVLKMTDAEKDLRAIFRSIDADHSGHVSIDELVDLINKDPAERQLLQPSSSSARSKSPAPQSDEPAPKREPDPKLVAKLAHLTGERADIIERMRTRLKAAAYTTGGTDWEKLFREQDKDHSGDISWDEFYSMCRRVLKMSDDRNKLRSVFRLLDADHSGEVSIDELVDLISIEPVKKSKSPRSPRGASPASTRVPSPPARSAEAEERTDTEIGKQLAKCTPAEKELMKKVCSRVQAAAYTTGGADLKKLLHEQDKDHSGEISWDEFYSMCRRVLKLTESQEDLRIVFNLVDEDHSGDVSIEELVDLVHEACLHRAPRIEKVYSTGAQRIEELHKEHGEKLSTREKQLEQKREAEAQELQDQRALFRQHLKSCRYVTCDFDPHAAAARLYRDYEIREISKVKRRNEHQMQQEAVPPLHRRRAESVPNVAATFDRLYNDSQDRVLRLKERQDQLENDDPDRWRRQLREDLDDEKKVALDTGKTVRENLHDKLFNDAATRAQKLEAKMKEKRDEEDSKRIPTTRKPVSEIPRLEELYKHHEIRLRNRELGLNREEYREAVGPQASRSVSPRRLPEDAAVLVITLGLKRLNRKLLESPENVTVAEQLRSKISDIIKGEAGEVLSGGDVVVTFAEDGRETTTVEIAVALPSAKAAETMHSEIVNSGTVQSKVLAAARCIEGIEKATAGQTAEELDITQMHVKDVIPSQSQPPSQPPSRPQLKLKLGSGKSEEATASANTTPRTTPRTGAATPRAGDVTPRGGDTTPRGGGDTTPRGGAATTPRSLGTRSGAVTPRGGAATASTRSGASTPRGGYGATTASSRSGACTPRSMASTAPAKAPFEPTTPEQNLTSAVCMAINWRCGHDLAATGDLKDLTAPLGKAVAEYRAAQGRCERCEGYHMLCQRESQYLVQERLRSESEIVGLSLEPDPVWQLDESLESVLLAGQVAQLLLKERINPIRYNAKLWPPGTKQMKPMAVPMAIFAHNPGPKVSKEAEIKAQVRFGPAEASMRFKHLTDLARLTIVFESCSLLMMGWDLIQKTFEVIAIRNYFKNPERIGARFVEMLVVLQVPKGGMGPEKIPHVCELRLEENSFWKAQVAAEPHIDAFRDNLRRQLGPEGLHTEAAVYLAKVVLTTVPESHNLRTFRRKVNKHFGSLVGGFRRFACNDRLLSFSKFRDMCRAMKSGDHATEHWLELVQGHGVMSLFEFDAEAVALLSRLLSRLRGLKETVEQQETAEMFFSRLSLMVIPKPKQTGRLELHELRAALKQLGFGAADSDRIFRYLDKHNGSSSAITPPDLGWLRKLAKLVDLEAVTLLAPRRPVASQESEVNCYAGKRWAANADVLNAPRSPSPSSPGNRLEPAAGQVKMLGSVLGASGDLQPPSTPSSFAERMRPV